MASYNKKLGMFELTGLPPAPAGCADRGRFDIDANGIVHVLGQGPLLPARSSACTISAQRRFGHQGRVVR
jgi:molecular chaperone DnaK (HSP70)